MGEQIASEHADLLGLAMQENEKLSIENRELKTQLATERDNFAALSAWRDSGEADVTPSETLTGTVPMVFGSVQEALERAAKDNDDVLRVFPSAKESAHTSGFQRPADVYQGITEIAALGRAYFGADNRKIGPWCERFSFKYAHTESRTTKARYLDSRTFVDPSGEKQIMLRHLTLGGGDAVNCLQIYFEPDEKSDTMGIGYCGVHLPYAKQRT